MLMALHFSSTRVECSLESVEQSWIMVLLL
ncbi:hypothetical protein LINPERPRIM_LOCUS3314 [Linum perenne]